MKKFLVISMMSLALSNAAVASSRDQDIENDIFSESYRIYESPTRVNHPQEPQAPVKPAYRRTVSPSPVKAIDFEGVGYKRKRTYTPQR